MAEQFIERVHVRNLFAVDERAILAANILGVAHFTATATQKRPFANVKRNARCPLYAKTVYVHIAQTLLNAFQRVQTIRRALRISVCSHHGCFRLLADVGRVVYAWNAPIGCIAGFTRKVQRRVFAGQMIKIHLVYCDHVAGRHEQSRPFVQIDQMPIDLRDVSERDALALGIFRIAPVA